jgi:transcriptional regulator with XRE-family HTH domain
MTPKEIKIALIERDVTMQSIADRMEVDGSHVSQIISGKRRSVRVEKAIANAIGRPVAEVFAPVAQLEGTAA